MYQLGIVLNEDDCVMDFVKQQILALDGSSTAEAPSEVNSLLKQFQFSKGSE